MKNSMRLWRLTALGLMTALVFAGNFARIPIPIPIGGTTAFTLGNIICVLSGLLLGPIGGVASGLGAALYDLSNPLYANEVPFTFFNKLVMGLAAGLVAQGLHRRRPGLRRCLLAAIAGCVSYYLLYFLKSYFYNGLLVEGLPPEVALATLPLKIPASLFNAAVAVAAAPALCLAIRQALDRSGMRPLS